MTAFSHGSVSPPATSAPHRWRIAAANAAGPLATTASVALIGATVGIAAGVPGMLAGTVLGGVTGLLAVRAFARRGALPLWEDPGGAEVEIDAPLRNERGESGPTRPPSSPSSLGALLRPRRSLRPLLGWIARTVGVAMMLLGFLSAACGILWAVDNFYSDPDPQPAVLFASIFSVTLIAVGFAIWSASSRLRHR
jgi:hypothetical protein